MTIETVTYISDLNPAYPGSGDSPSEGDDHLRNLKTGIKNTFPNVTGAVNATQGELNQVHGMAAGTAASVTQLGLVLLQAQSASNSATIDFTTNIGNTYDEYELHIVNAVPASGGVAGWLRTSPDGGVTWNANSGDYDYTLWYAGGTTMTVANGSTTAASIQIAPLSIVSGAQWGYLSAVIRFYQPAGTTQNKRCTWTGSCGGGSGPGSLIPIGGAGARTAVAAINGVRFLFNTGNITSGNFYLYGVRKV